MRAKYLALTLTLVAILVVLGGCELLGLGPEPAPVTVTQAKPAPLELDMTGTIGSQFVVVLPGNPSTGYQWEVEHNPAAITLVSDEYVADDPNGAPGSGGRFRFTFEPVRNGETLMVFRYQRPGDAEASKTVVYRVMVS